MTDGEKGLGLIIALMGAELGASQIRRYGQKGDTSPKKVLNKDTLRLLEIETTEEELE